MHIPIASALANHSDIFCVASNGIVIATEKKSSSILIDDSMLEKVAIICPNIGIVYSGMGPDFRILIAKARKSAQAYWKIYGEYPPTRVLTQEIATVMQEATQSGYASDETLMPTGYKVECLAVAYGRMVFHCSSQDSM